MRRSVLSIYNAVVPLLQFVCGPALCEAIIRADRRVVQNTSRCRQILFVLARDRSMTVVPHKLPPGGTLRDQLRAPFRSDGWGAVNYLVRIGRYHWTQRCLAPVCRVLGIGALVTC